MLGSVGSVRILLVEDDVELGRVLEQGLGEEGFVLTRAVDGEAALLALRGTAFDVCVLDVSLPKRDGLEVLTTARREQIATPILLLTARAALEDRVQGLDLGADDFLGKPFAFAELVARLRALHRRPAAYHTPLLSAGTLTLDVGRHELRSNGELIAVSPTQFRLLELLLQRAGEVVSRATIFRHVWSYSFDPGTNLIDVHVAHLRGKLDRAGEPSIIETVRGVGYRLRTDA